MTLGEKIQKLRQEHNISQKELAAKLNVSTAEIAVWEADESIPSIADIAKMSSALGVSTDTLIVDSDLSVDRTVSIQEKEDLNEASPDSKPAAKKSKKGKRFLTIFVFLIVLAGIAIAGFFGYKHFLPFSKNTAAIEKAASSVVKIYCYDYEGNQVATGSGFVAFDDRTIVTNYHVLEEAYTAKVSTDEDKTYEVTRIMEYSKEYDLAIIKLKESTGLDILEFGASDLVKKGETVTAIGSPLGIKNSVSQGVLSGRLMNENMDVLQFTAAISSGSSGGALFDEEGKVIGITYASFINGQNLNLAIPIELVQKSYNRNDTITHNVSAIYLEAHPHIEYLDDYNDAITVTFEELIQKPEFYDEKLVKIDTYVSSRDDELDYYYFGNLENLTGDYNLDKSISGSFISKIAYKNRKVLLASTLYCNYRDESISIGDRVTIIGTFHHLKLDPAKSSYEGGTIHTMLVYKNNT